MTILGWKSVILVWLKSWERESWGSGKKISGQTCTVFKVTNPRRLCTVKKEKEIWHALAQVKSHKWGTISSYVTQLQETSHNFMKPSLWYDCTPNEISQVFSLYRCSFINYSTAVTLEGNTEEENNGYVVFKSTDQLGNWVGVRGEGVIPPALSTAGLWTNI
jgi:hypothetical protein